MKIINIMLTSLYLHFLKMKDRGRRVIPWFSTCVAMSFFITITVTFIVKLIGGENMNKYNLSTGVFDSVFMLIGILCFFFIKSYFFDSKRYLYLSESYLKNYSSQKRLLYKIFTLTILIVSPFLLGFLIWLYAKPLK